MGKIAAIGEETRARPFALVGAVVIAANTPDDVVRAWHSIASDVDVIVLTPSAAKALGDLVAQAGERLVVTLP